VITGNLVAGALALLTPPPAPNPVTVTNTVEVARDWPAFWVNLITAVLTVGLAAAALFVAIGAKSDAQKAETRSRESIVAERRLVFALETLRDLADATDDGTALTRDFASRLLIVPDLLEWIRYAKLRTEISDDKLRYGEFLGVPTTPPKDDLEKRARDKLRDDVKAAIKRRLEATERPA
jgi:hypothetical protein